MARWAALWLAIWATALLLGASASERRCWFLAAPSLATDLSLSARVQSFLFSVNATSVSVQLITIPVDSLAPGGAKDVWSEALNRYNERWSVNSDRNDLGYKSGVESVSKTWGLFVQYSLQQVSNCPQLSAEGSYAFIGIPFGQIPGITGDKSNAATAVASPKSTRLFILLLALAASSPLLVGWAFE